MSPETFNAAAAYRRIGRFWTLVVVYALVIAIVFLTFMLFHRGAAFAEPVWVAATKANCSGLTVVLFVGVEQDGEPTPEPFWRMYFDPDNPPRGLKTFKAVNGEPYFRGKPCGVAD